MATEVLRRRFDVEAYHRMGQAGILTEEDRVELIEGEIIEMTPIGRRHLAAVDYLNHRFTIECGDRAIVRVQGAIRLSRFSEPQPDLLLLRPRADFYRMADAGPADVLLLVEVAETSLAYDQTVKLSLYAQAGIPEVWLVNLAGERVEVYRTPAGDQFRDVEQVLRGRSIAPRAFPDLAILLDEIVG